MKPTVLASSMAHGSAAPSWLALTGSGERIISSLYGRTAEHFDAMPLLAIAAVLLNGKLRGLLQARAFAGDRTRNPASPPLRPISGCHRRRGRSA